MKNQISDLRNHLYESIEMLKNNSDPVASANEKMDIGTAKQISALAGNLIDSYKLEVEAIEIISKAQNPNTAVGMLNGSGLFSTTLELPSNK